MSAILAVLGRGLVPSDEPVAHADDAGLTRGDGCFEGCRLRPGERTIDKLDAHLARMSRSAAALEIDFDETAWRDLAGLAATAWAERVGGEAAVKLLLTRGRASDDRPVGFVRIESIGARSLALRRDGLRVITLERGVPADAFAGAPWLLGGVKTLSYAVNMAAQREAERRGADDVIYVSTDRLVLEGPTSSVVWTTGRTLYTTPTGPSGILAGTTQARLFDRAAAAGWPVDTALVGVDELHAADVVWLVSSVRGPIEVVELDGKTRPRLPEVDAEIRALCGF